MQIETNISCKLNNYVTNNFIVEEIGKYTISAIDDWGNSLIVHLTSLNTCCNDIIKIYVDKDKFRSFFSAGDMVTRFRRTPETGIKVIELEGELLADNTMDFFIHTETGNRSELFFPWDPYW